MFIFTGQWGHGITDTSMILPMFDLRVTLTILGFKIRELTGGCPATKKGVGREVGLLAPIDLTWVDPAPPL